MLGPACHGRTAGSRARTPVSWAARQNRGSHRHSRSDASNWGWRNRNKRQTGRCVIIFIPISFMADFVVIPAFPPIHHIHRQSQLAAATVQTPLYRLNSAQPLASEAIHVICRHPKTEEMRLFLRARTQQHSCNHCVHPRTQPPTASEEVTDG